MEATVLRSEMLRQLDTGELFTMEFVTADRKRGTGGELVRLENWQKINGVPAVEGSTTQKRSAQPLGKNPHHRLNKTVNLHNPHNKGVHPITVHIKLIQTFNGKRVTNG